MPSRPQTTRELPALESKVAIKGDRDVLFERAFSIEG